MDISETGDIVIRAFVETDNNIFNDTIGIWVKRGNEFEAVAFEEGPVPELPGVTFIPETNGVRGIDNFFLEPDGTIVYSGLFFENNVLKRGLFSHEVDSTAKIIFITGQQVDIGGEGHDIRTVSNMRPGIGSSDDGKKVAEVFFTNGSAGLFTYDVLEDSSVFGDLDGDGVVGTSDLLIMFSQWGPCGDCNDCPADLDDNCSVSVSDLLVLFANWG